MTNGDWIRSLSNEQIAMFLAVDRYMRLEKFFEYVGYGITREAMYLQNLKWVNEEFKLPEIEKSNEGEE